MDSANRNLIDPNVTFLSKDEIIRIQAEVGVYYVEEGNKDKAFASHDSDVYAEMDKLLPNGQKVKDVADKADLMIAGYGEFTDEQIANVAVSYLELCIKQFNDEDTALDNQKYSTSEFQFCCVEGSYKQSAENDAAKAFHLLKNDQILKLVKEKLGADKYQEIINVIKDKTSSRIDYSTIMLKSSGTKLDLEPDEIKNNKAQVEYLRKVVTLTENSYRNSVDEEGFKQDFVNYMRESMLTSGSTRADMDNYYAIVKSNLSKLEMAAEGKLVDSDGKPIPFEKAVESITGMKLDELNNEFLAAQTYGEMGLDITIALVTMPVGGAGGVKGLATLGKSVQALNTLSKTRTALNIASAFGGGLVSSGTQYTLDRANLASSVSGNTMKNRAAIENKAAETGVMGALGMGIGGQTEIIASRFSSTTARVVTNIIGYGADLGSATFMTGAFHDGNWDEGLTMNAVFTSIGYVAGIRSAVKTRGLSNKPDLDALLNMHKMGKGQPEPLNESQLNSLKKLNLDEAKNYLDDRGFNVKVEDNTLVYVDNNSIHILEFDSNTGIVSKVSDQSIKLSDKEFNEILKQMKNSDEAEFNRIKSELEQGDLTPEQIEALNKVEPKKVVEPITEPEPASDKGVNLEDIQNQELKQQLENINENGQVVAVSDGETVHYLYKKDGKIYESQGVIIGSGNEAPIKMSKEEFEKLFPKKIDKKTDVNLRQRLGEKLHKTYVQIEQMIEKAKTLADLSSLKAMIEHKFANFKAEMNALLDKLNIKMSSLKRNNIQESEVKPVARKSQKLTNGQTNELRPDDKLIVGNNVLDMENLPDNIRQKIDALGDGQSVTLGRNDIDPNDMHISGEHLIISKENGKLIIKDTSTNGTRIFDKENFNAYRTIKQNTVSNNGFKSKEYLSSEKAFLDATGGDYVLLNKILASNDYKATYQLQNILKSTTKNNKSILETFASGNLRKGEVLSETTAVSTDDLGLLMMFNRNNADVQSLINSTSKVQNYLKKTNELLDKLEAQKFSYIDKQTYQSVEMDVNKDLVSTIRRGGFDYEGEFVKAELNNNILNDMEAMIHGKSYIPEFKSGTKLSQAFNNTKLGDAVAIGDKMYVNDGTSLVPLNYNRQQYEKLFPPMERFNITQGAIGDCYLVSTIDALMDSPKGRAEIYQMFSVDNNGKVNIKIASGNGHVYIHERFDSKGGHSQHENGLAMLEQAYAKFEIRNARRGAASGQTMINFNIDGGWMNDVTHGLLGGTSGKVMKNKEVFSSMIDAYANDPNQILQFGTILENDHFSALDPQYNIQYKHAYTVKGYNVETGMVQIANPWHSGLTIEIPKERLLMDMDAMTIYDMNQGK